MNIMENALLVIIHIIGMKQRECVLPALKHMSLVSNKENANAQKSYHMTLDFNVSAVLSLNIGMTIQKLVNNVHQILTILKVN